MAFFNEFFANLATFWLVSDKIKASSRELIQEIKAKEHIIPKKGGTMLNFVYFTCHKRIIIIFKQELHLFLKQIFQKSLPTLLPIR